VVGGALGTLLGRVYYVLKDTRTPAILGLLEIVGYALYLPPLARLYGAVGVAMANAIYLDVAWLVGGVIVFRKLKVSGNSGLTGSTLRLGLISLIAGGVAYGVGFWLRQAPFFALALGSLAGAAFYFAVLYVFRIQELIWVGSWLQSSWLGKPMGWLLNPLLARKGVTYGP